MCGRITLVLLVVASNLAAVEPSRPNVRAIRTPNNGIQPQVVLGNDGTLHMLYYHGEAAGGDIYYVTSPDFGDSFSKPIRVNTQSESAIAAGTIRGAHLALGKEDRVHVAWNGSGKAKPKGLPNPDIPEESPYRFSSPMLYSRLNVDGTGFEPQRNLMQHTYALDGGGSVAADAQGRVYVVWHANSTQGARGEGARAVWVATSLDEGQAFSREVQANRAPTGACGCCGLRAATSIDDRLYVLYRSAQDGFHRDMHVLVSRDQGRSFEAKKLDEWEIGKCVMSSASFFPTSTGMLAAWETQQQVKFGPVHRSSAIRWDASSPSLDNVSQKHPTLAVNARGETLLAWTEGTGWLKGGSVAWQVFDAMGTPISGTAGRERGVPVWGLVAAFASKSGDFTVVY